MKVLLATMQYGRGYGQGTERYVLMLADGLHAHGHTTVVLGGDPERRGPTLPLGTPLETDPGVLYYPTRGWMSVVGISPEELRPILDRERPDIVHVVNPGHIGVGLMTAAKQAGLPLVATIVDYWWLCPKHILLHPDRGICDGHVPWRECVRCIGAVDQRPWVRTLARAPGLNATALPLLYFTRALTRGATLAECARWTRRQPLLLAALDSADAVIFLSEGARARLAPRLSRARLHTIIVGMEDRWFATPKRSASDGAPRDPASLALGFVGALADHKGTHLILDAVRRLGWHRTRVRIAGGGTDTDYQQRLRRLAAGLNVDFTGRVPSADVPAFLAGLDVLIVPSTWPENLPQTVLEAQAVGTPVIASRVDGIAEVIADPALLFDVGSAADLARALADWAACPRTPPPAKPVRRAAEMVADTLAVYDEVRR